jgi:hypothetical protein
MIAPADLRIDGVYSERHCAPAFPLFQNATDRADAATTSGMWNFALHGGVLGFWVKPGFFPEHTGKVRNFVSMGKFHNKGDYRNPAPFGLMFMPAHDRPGYEGAAACETGAYVGGASTAGGGIPILARRCDYRHPFQNMYDGNIPVAEAGVPVEKRGLQAKGIWQIRPMSLVGVRAATTADAGYHNPTGGIPELVDVENWACTSSLNHNLHHHGLDSGSHLIAGAAGGASTDPTSTRSTPGGGEEGAVPWPNYLEGHRWTHVLMCWQMVPPW